MNYDKQMAVPTQGEPNNKYTSKGLSRGLQQETQINKKDENIAYTGIFIVTATVYQLAGATLQMEISELRRQHG